MGEKKEELLPWLPSDGQSDEDADNDVDLAEQMETAALVTPDTMKIQKNKTSLNLRGYTRIGCIFVMQGILLSLIISGFLFVMPPLHVNVVDDEPSAISISTVGNESDSTTVTNPTVAASDTSSNGSEEHVVADPKLLDFAVVGFGKCGTTSLMKFLNIENTTFEGDGEHCPESREKLFELYGEYVNTSIMTGYKCPSGLLNKPDLIRTYQNNVPHPKLIASVRHPVTHFQSSYNFFFSERPPPDPLELLGHCGSVCKSHPKEILIQNPDRLECLPVRKVCTTRSSMFQYALSRLHLTPMEDREEMELLDFHKLETVPEFNGTLFLMESGQLPEMAANTSTGVAIKDSLESYIGLPPKSLVDREFPPKPNHDDRTRTQMNICDEKYEVLRNELVKRGRKAGHWILEYLLKSDRVVVPDRDHFVELIRNWSVDPCIKAKYIL